MNVLRPSAYVGSYIDHLQNCSSVGIQMPSKTDILWIHQADRKIYGKYKLPIDESRLNKYPMI